MCVLIILKLIKVCLVYRFGNENESQHFLYKIELRRVGSTKVRNGK